MAASILADLQCKCGWRTEGAVETTKAAEILAERHETGTAWRRPYQHDVAITLHRVAA